MIDNKTNEDIQEADDSDDKKTDPNSAKERAAKAGHQDYETYIANGGEAEKYQAPEIFLALKGPLTKIKDQTKRFKQQEREFNDRLKGINDYHTQQLESQRDQLIQQRDTAFDESDAEQARAYQKQLDNLKPVPQTPINQPAQQQVSEELNNWNNNPRNNWYKTPGPRQLYANTQFESYRVQGHDDATAIRLMESDISKHFPEINQNITGAPMAEGGSKPGNKAAPRKLTLKDLTAEEASIFRHRPDGMWSTEDAFLQAVADSRGLNDA